MPHPRFSQNAMALLFWYPEVPWFISSPAAIRLELLAMSNLSRRRLMQPTSRNSKPYLYAIPIVVMVASIVLLDTGYNHLGSARVLDVRCHTHSISGLSPTAATWTHVFLGAGSNRLW